MAHKGQAIFMVYTDLIDPRYEEEFNAWYNTEHLPELLALPGVLDAARYVATRGGPTHLAVYELASVDAMQTPEFKNRPRTPWAGASLLQSLAKTSHALWDSRSSQVVWRVPSVGWPQPSRSAACRCLRVPMRSGMRGITASTSPAIVQCQASSMRGASASSRARCAIPRCMNSSTTRYPTVRPGISSANILPRTLDACATR